MARPLINLSSVRDAFVAWYDDDLKWRQDSPTYAALYHVWGTVQAFLWEDADTINRATSNIFLHSASVYQLKYNAADMAAFFASRSTINS